MIINSISYVTKIDRINQYFNLINFTSEISLLYQQYILLNYSYTSLIKNELMYYETYKPRTPASKKTALNSSTARRNKVQSSVQKRKNMRSLNNSHQKSQSRYGSHSRKSKSKNKFNVFDKKVCKVFLLDYDVKKGKKCRHIAYIPQTIRFKDSTKNSQNNMTKTQKIKKKQVPNPQNKQNQLNQNNKQEQHYIPNRDLLKTSLKPNKLNFMARASNVYDLLISKVMLPQFIEYFLGEALYVVNKNSKNSSTNNRIESIYDWRLDQFKKICQKIYENSQQQDLKHFMSLSLPTINRWSSKQSSTKHSSTQPTNTLATHTQNSRITDNTISTYNNKDRASYFRCLNKKERVCLGDQKQSIDILDKLNSKLDNYLQNNLHKIGQEQGVLSQINFNKWNHKVKQ